MDSKSKHEELEQEGKIKKPENKYVFWEEQDFDFRPNHLAMEPTRRLKIFEEVNSAETLEHLARIIEDLADDRGYIKGRSKEFSATRMAMVCRDFDNYPTNYLTREFGIRQQAMYILYYEGKMSRSLKG